MYNIPGTYSVTLEVTNIAGTDTETITSYIVVEDVPQPDFNATITGATAIFTNTSSGGNSYLLNFGDGNESMEESPFHIYENDGNYTVTLTVTNSCGNRELFVLVPETVLSKMTLRSLSNYYSPAGLYHAFFVDASYVCL